jgi:hypothetical protein
MEFIIKSFGIISLFMCGMILLILILNSLNIFVCRIKKRYLIVYCKYCKHGEKHGNMGMFCNKLNRRLMDNDNYCKFGETK